MSAFILLIPILLLVALALPVALAEKSWLRFLAAMFLSFFVVLLPLFVFFFSSFMTPEWKGACRHGWVDCFIVGKLAFTPFVLFATAALYKREVLREKNVTDRWPVLGIYLGAIVAVTCAVFGWVCLPQREWRPLNLVPLYVAVWYAIRAGQLMWQSPVGFWNYFWATLATVPSWLTSWQWSRQVYESLPNQAPSGCFVVTAAGRGHQKFVGPFFEITRHGGRLRANQQLLTLWQFENLWRKKFPRSHKHFRRAYNRLGPVIAAQIKSPWLADLFFLALKPVELTAKLLTRVQDGDGARRSRRFNAQSPVPCKMPGPLAFFTLKRRERRAPPAPKFHRPILEASTINLKRRKNYEPRQMD